MSNSDWERFNNQFRETEWERNDRLRTSRLQAARNKALAKEDETSELPTPQPPIGE